MFYIIGLGNPGEEYSGTRHNTGKMAVSHFQARNSKSEIPNLKIIESKEFMNNSGKAIAKFIKPKTGKNKAQENLIVVHDDLDLPLGVLKISYNKGVGGHRGLGSVAKAVKTLEFVRIRIGVSPHSAKATRGKPTIKKPGAGLPAKAAEKAVIDFILGKWKPKELEILKKTFKKVSEAIAVIVEDGRDRAMNMFN